MSEFWVLPLQRFFCTILLLLSVICVQFMNLGLISRFNKYLCCKYGILHIIQIYNLFFLTKMNKKRQHLKKNNFKKILCDSVNSLQTPKPLLLKFQCVCLICLWTNVISANMLLIILIYSKSSVGKLCKGLFNTFVPSN